MSIPILAVKLTTYLTKFRINLPPVFIGQLSPVSLKFGPSPRRFSIKGDAESLKNNEKEMINEE